MRRITPCLALPLGIAALVLQAPAQAGAVPFWGAKASVPIDTPIDELKKGQFLWMGDAMSMTVVIASAATEPERVDHPGYLAPVSFEGGAPITRDPLAPGEIERWQPELSASGPVSIVLSQGSRRVVVYRNGIEIGRARMTISGEEPITSHALVLIEGPSSVPDPYVPDPTKYRWVRIGVPGHRRKPGLR